MNLRNLTRVMIGLAMAFGLVSLLNGWTKTAAASGAIVVVLSVFFIAMENWVRRRLRGEQEMETAEALKPKG